MFMLNYRGCLLSRTPVFVGGSKIGCHSVTLFLYVLLSVASVVGAFESRDCSPPGSPVHGILQARILEWVAVPSSRGSHPRDQTPVSYVSCTALHCTALHCRWILTHGATWEAHYFCRTFLSKNSFHLLSIYHGQGNVLKSLTSDFHAFNIYMTSL